MTERRLILTLGIVISMFATEGLAGTGDTSWMTEGKYGLFMHYQYRILLNYSIRTDPIMPSASQMTSTQWNRFVDGFDVKGFADQMAEAKVGWVLFCIDDRYQDKIAGWWFDGIQLNAYNDKPYDWWKINSIVHAAISIRNGVKGE